MIVPVKYVVNSLKNWVTYNIENSKKQNSFLINFKAFKNFKILKFSNFYYFKSCIHFAIIIVNYLTLIRLRSVELRFRQTKRKYIQYNTILVFIHPFFVSLWLDKLHIAEGIQFLMEIVFFPFLQY